MLSRLIAACSFTLLWVISLLVIFALAGILIVSIAPGWIPFFVYVCIGLYCAWVVFRRTGKVNAKPISILLKLQIGFILLLALICWLLGQQQLLGFSPQISQLALLPWVLFLLLWLRHQLFTRAGIKAQLSKRKGTYLPTLMSRFFGLLGYSWLLLAMAILALAMLGIFITDFFTGVSLMVVPTNLVSWLVIAALFLPAFVLLEIAHYSRKLRPF